MHVLYVIYVFIFGILRLDVDILYTEIYYVSQHMVDYELKIFMIKISQMIKNPFVEN